MPQNIYDDDAFFAEYAKLRRSLEGLEGAQEWPAMRALLPELDSRRVLDLGCGFGWFCRWARENGAASVLDIDVSENMLARAREMTADPAIDYARSDMEIFELPTGPLDLVYSSLALHYIEDFSALVGAVHRWLAPWSIRSSPHRSMRSGQRTRRARRAGRWTTIFDEGPRSTDWLAKGVVKQHRTLTTTLNTLIRTGFVLTHVEEWAPTAEQAASWPSLAGDRQRPSFLLVAASR